MPGDSWFACHVRRRSRGVTAPDGTDRKNGRGHVPSPGKALNHGLGEWNTCRVRGINRGIRTRHSVRIKSHRSRLFFRENRNTPLTVRENARGWGRVFRTPERAWTHRTRDVATCVRHGSREQPPDRRGDDGVRVLGGPADFLNGGWRAGPTCRGGGGVLFLVLFLFIVFAVVFVLPVSVTGRTLSAASRVSSAASAYTVVVVLLRRRRRAPAEGWDRGGELRSDGGAGGGGEERRRREDRASARSGRQRHTRHRRHRHDAPRAQYRVFPAPRTPHVVAPRTRTRSVRPSVCRASPNRGWYRATRPRFDFSVAFFFHPHRFPFSPPDFRFRTSRRVPVASDCPRGGHAPNRSSPIVLVLLLLTCGEYS